MDIRTIEAISTTLDGIGDAQDREIARDYIADLRRQLAEALGDAPAHLRNECSRLRKEIERRGQTARETEMQLSAAEDEAADLRRQLAEAQAEIAAVHRQLAEARMRANAAEFAVAQQRDEAADLRRQVGQARTEAGMLRRQLQEGEQSALSQALGQIAYLRRQLAEMQEEIEKFEVLGIAAGADNPTSPESILTAILHMTTAEEEMIDQLRQRAAELEREIIWPVISRA